MSNRSPFYDQSLEDLTDRILAWDEPGYRARQLWQGIYAHLKEGPESLQELPAELRQRLEIAFSFSTMKVSASASSQDGTTTKILLGLKDEQAVEAVLMRYEKRRTACISTQVGCAMGCVFCATGQMGFVRNLSAGEIIEQVLFLARMLSRNQDRLTNVVVMGMGEPFHNYDATLEAIDRLNHPLGFNFGARRITISTIGLIPMIERFTEERRQTNLAISLHAASNELRSKLLPINHRYPLDELIPACSAYVQHTGRRITFEWALIRDLNDGLDQAEALVNLIKGINCHVNLIPLNPTRGYSGKATSDKAVQVFFEYLTNHGIPCTVRARRGIDIQAGCGQLAIEQSHER